MKNAVEGVRPQPLVPLVTVFAVLLIRPNILGESYSAVGAALMVAAALMSLAHDQRNRAASHRRFIAFTTVVFAGLSYGWALWLYSNVHSVTDQAYRSTVQGCVLTTITLAALAVVLRDEDRRERVARAFLWVVITCCASFAATAILGLAIGIGRGQVVTEIPVGGFGLQPVYFPFTTTVSTLDLAGLHLPRFVGIGREPAWMAMYCAVSYFLLPLVDKPKLWKQGLLVLGLLGTLSTTGFCLFVVVWAYWAFIRPRPYKTPFGAYLRQVLGLGLLGGAAWVAFYAPNLGIAAKQQVNEVSYDERLHSISAGWAALRGFRWIGDFGPTSITLMGSMASLGLVYAAMVLAAFLAPRLHHAAKSLTTAPVAVVVGTLLFSQPVGDSTWAYGVAMVIYAAAVPQKPSLVHADATDTSSQPQESAHTASGSGSTGRRW